MPNRYRWSERKRIHCWLVPSTLPLERTSCEQLRGNGVAATMVLPLGIDGELVGAIHAEHGSPRRCGAERRSVIHLFAERLIARMARRGWKP